MQYQKASAKKALPVDCELAKVMAAIMAGGEGTIRGCDLLACLLTSGVKNLGMAKQLSGCGYCDDIVFIKKEDGSVVAEEVRSACKYDAQMIRAIVGFCQTEPRFLLDSFRRNLPTVEDLAKRLETI